MADDRDELDELAEDADAFERKVSAVFDTEAEMLRAKSELLLATGSISIDRPAGVLTASLRSPRRWQNGIFRASAVKEDGSTTSGFVPLSRTMDAASVLGEITLQLAVNVAWLDE